MKEREECIPVLCIAFVWQFQLDVTFVLSLHFSLGKHLAREEQNVRGIVLHVNSNICRSRPKEVTLQGRIQSLESIFQYLSFFMEFEFGTKYGRRYYYTIRAEYFKLRYIDDMWTKMQIIWMRLRLIIYRIFNRQ